MRKIDLTDFQVATSETARLINRRIALNFILRHQPLSRADLARHLGLQRSTVSAITDQLIDEGWVTEGAIGRVPRGRPPRYLHLNVKRAGIIAVDVRPETTTVGLAGVDARFVRQTAWPTPAAPQPFVRQLVKTVAAFRAEFRKMVCEGVGVSLPGRVDSEGNLVFAPNLRWPSINIREFIERAVGVPVVVENAANACVLAEFWFGGHADDVQNLIAVTVSEGIGVGLLLNGQLVHGGQAMAGEFGHVTIDENGPACPCGKRGCWERYASNSAAVHAYRTAVGLPASGLGAPCFERILHLAETGDQAAGVALDHMAEFLGFGLASLATGLGPDAIVIVGEVTGAWQRVGPIVADVMKRRSLPHVKTRIVPTDPAVQPRLRGAVSLVVQQHFGAPKVA